MGVRDIAASTPPVASSCHNCGLLAWCLPANLTLEQTAQLNRLTKHQREIERGQYLHQAGATLNLLYVIRSGSFKTSITDATGREQVTGFTFPGDLTGIGAIDTGRHLCNVLALENSTVCGIPYVDLERLARGIPSLQRHFHRAMSKEISRDYGLMLQLGSMSARERIALFLLNFSKRRAARGHSATHLTLRMTRMDIGSYLGLRLETISRALSQLREDQIIAVEGKAIEIKNLAQLHLTIRYPDARRDQLSLDDDRMSDKGLLKRCASRCGHIKP
jgi:CRP/FNR family transcriptional regulator